VISNGTAISARQSRRAGLEAGAWKGKAVLLQALRRHRFHRPRIGTEDVDEFINAVRFLGPSFGGINLEDIRAPDCFIIESRLRELMDIPVFHDDQHGTAIIALAGLMNALHLTGRDIATTRLVCNGAGARRSPAWSSSRPSACQAGTSSSAIPRARSTKAARPG
jgi:malate dehydrogenase (oxaloacetate-decarboxylating)(NADP+)